MIRKDYTFDASAQTITFTNEVSIEQIGVITNVVDGVQIYNPMDVTKIGTLSGKVLTLAYNTAAMSDTDALQVFYGNSDASLLVSDELAQNMLWRMLDVLMSPAGYDSSTQRQRGNPKGAQAIRRTMTPSTLLHPLRLDARLRTSSSAMGERRQNACLT